MIAFMKRWWGVPAGLIALVVGLLFAAARIDNQHRADQHRLDARAHAYAQAIVVAEKSWWAQHRAYTDNVADLAEVDPSPDDALDVGAGFEHGLRADIVVSQSGQVALVRVAGQRTHAAQLRDGR